MHHALVKYYGDATLSQARTNILITAFDEVNWKPKLFKSTKAKLDPHEDYPLWFAAQATASAPTYFPNLEGFVDGGMVGATNPSMIAYTEARILWPQEELFLLSLGTGYTNESIDAKKSENWGQIDFLKSDSSIIDMTLDGPEKIVEYMIESLLGPDHYVRAQKLLTKISDGPSTTLDDASEDNMKKLVEFGKQVVEDNKPGLMKIVDLYKK